MGEGLQDLALRRAGEGALQVANEMRAAARTRSWLRRLFALTSIEEKSWRAGAEGERLVGAQLAHLVRLYPGWRVLHGIPVGSAGADIDHLVIGPGGVFSITTRHHPQGRVQVKGDVVLVNGQRVSYVRNSRFEAAYASRLLSAAVGFPVQARALAVTVGADLVVAGQPEGLTFCDRRRVVDLLRKAPTILSPSQIMQLYAVARHPDTWSADVRIPSPRPPVDQARSPLS
ncbi:nuclease-related domain-containing protein [Nocardioides cavernaquae]|uniref:NERD domain-containing protein n=1 Tax=Nocardioides cavernaquae TaxID=2321396 RepID=A0A3A5H739_9ACTN|nr:nuclease-related domain-containing protein [Nocardioides cavernaquae]RJS46473.1 NERD domain-containing protein [Nocardioides cavernaquae]